LTRLPTGAPAAGRASRLSLPASLALGALLLLLAALWVPINRRPVPLAYFQLDLAAGLQPRALSGTLAHALHLSPADFVRMGLLSELLFLTLLLRELSAGEATRWSARSLAALVATAALLCWFQVVFWGHFFSGFVDIHSHLLLLLSWLIVSRREDGPGAGALVAAAGVSALSLLNHEKALFDAALLTAWLWWRAGARRAGVYAAIVIAAFLGLMGFASEDSRVGLPFFDYVRMMGAFESDSVVGVLWAAGVAWGLAAWAAVAAIRDERGGGLRTGVFVATSTAIAFAPLLVAHDTNRMLGVMWFPTLMLLREVDFASRLRRPAVATGMLVLLLLQLALPPLFVFEHRAIPLDCYAQRSLRRLLGPEDQVGLDAVGGLIRLSEDAGHRAYYVRDCGEWAPFRNERRRRWW